MASAAGAEAVAAVEAAIAAIDAGDAASMRSVWEGIKASVRGSEFVALPGLQSSAIAEVEQELGAAVLPDYLRLSLTMCGSVEGLGESGFALVAPARYRIMSGADLHRLDLRKEALPADFRLLVLQWSTYRGFTSATVLSVDTGRLYTFERGRPTSADPVAAELTELKDMSPRKWTNVLRMNEFHVKAAIAAIQAGNV